MDLCHLVTQVLKLSEALLPYPTPRKAGVLFPQTTFIKSLYHYFLNQHSLRISVICLLEPGYTEPENYYVKQLLLGYLGFISP